MASTLIDRVDGLSSSAAIKGPCRVATTANITLSGLQTIDGVALVSGDRVLVKDQTAASQNGIFACDTGPWRRTRDFSQARDVVKGTAVSVSEGTMNGASFMQVTTDVPTIGISVILFGTLIPGGPQVIAALESALHLLPTTEPALPNKLWRNGGFIGYTG